MLALEVLVLLVGRLTEDGLAALELALFDLGVDTYEVEDVDQVEAGVDERHLKADIVFVELQPVGVRDLNQLRHVVFSFFED